MTIETETNYFGTVRYYKDSKLHREDGPAVIEADGTQVWYRDNIIHREDGPAVIFTDSGLQWYYYGTEYSFDEWCKKLNISDEQKTLLMLKYNCTDAKA